MSLETEFDVTGTIARLFIYPVKSCAGIEVQEAVLTETGLDLDRAWMVVDAQGHFLTQRTLPRMALDRRALPTPRSAGAAQHALSQNSNGRQNAGPPAAPGLPHGPPRHSCRR